MEIEKKWVHIGKSVWNLALQPGAGLALMHAIQDVYLDSRVTIA